jgi:LmbE family N-acetylglucosaminyl deacetylase
MTTPTPHSDDHPANPLKLMAILAHPDDESMGMGGTLARYAAEGVSTHLVTATRGEKGWFGLPAENPGPYGMGAIRQAELLNAAHMLKLHSVDFLNLIDGELAQANIHEATAHIVSLVRSIRPQVVVTFGPEGDYGHPDHIAISQLTAGALVCAADPMYPGETRPAHRVNKLYFMVNSPQMTGLLTEQFGDEIGIDVDGIHRGPVAWPEWAITTRLDVGEHWRTARKAILCHRSQLPSLGNIESLSDERWRTLLTAQGTFVRQYSLVGVSPGIEHDLFAGIR